MEFCCFVQTTSRRLAGRKVEKFEKNITKRGSVPETTTKKGKDYPVGPVLLGFFVFVVIGSCKTIHFNIIQLILFKTDFFVFISYSKFLFDTRHNDKVVPVMICEYLLFAWWFIWYTLNIIKLLWELDTINVWQLMKDHQGYQYSRVMNISKQSLFHFIASLVNGLWCLLVLQHIGG